MNYRNKNGFTLIEVMIAIFVIAVGFVAVIQMFPFGLRQGKISEMSSIAIYLAQEKMEEVFSQSYDAIAVGTTTEDYGSLFLTSFKRTTEINCVHRTDFSVVSCNYDETNDQNPMKKTEIIIYWEIPGGSLEESVNIISMIVKN